MYTIQPRGKEQELCRDVKVIPTETGTIQVTFPCISIHITDDRHDDYEGESRSYYCLTWSNYHGKRGVNPGKFKIQRVEYRPETLYVKDINGRRQKDRNGRWIVDQVGMNKAGQAGMVRHELWDDPPESGTISGAFAMITERFGAAIAQECLIQFVTHPTFLAFWTGNAADLFGKPQKRAA